MRDARKEVPRGPTADTLRSLPDEKLTEIAACANGEIQNCPECGTLTAFPGTATYNGESACHKCGHTRPV